MFWSYYRWFIHFFLYVAKYLAVFATFTVFLKSLLVFLKGLLTAQVAIRVNVTFKISAFITSEMTFHIFEIIESLKTISSSVCNVFTQETSYHSFIMHLIFHLKVGERTHRRFLTLHKKMKFFIKDIFSKCDQIQFPADMVTFTGEIFNRKLHFIVQCQIFYATLLNIKFKMHINF